MCLTAEPLFLHVVKGLLQGGKLAAHLVLDQGTDTALGGYVSGLGGWTWILDSRLVLSAGAGVQFLHYTINNLGPEGVFPALHTTVGYAF